MQSILVHLGRFLPVVALSLMIQVDAIAGKTCTVCLDEVRDEKVLPVTSLQCKHKHFIHKGCLAAQVHSHEDLRELKDLGLQCAGADSESEGGRCADRFSLKTVREALNLEQRRELDERLEKSSLPGDARTTQREIDRLSHGIERAFNICCPKEGCGAALGPIEGCNAAKCSNSDCQTLFCYLCLDEHEDELSVHEHVRGHSGSYWENRPGYLARYHWLLARKNLALLFSERVHPAVREAALHAVRPVLSENKMWPLPAGIMVEAWLSEVKTSELPLRAKVEILQNEYMYRRKTRDTKSANTIRYQIEDMNGKLIESLDVSDVGSSPAEPAAGREKGTRPELRPELRPEMKSSFTPEARPAPVPDVRARVFGGTNPEEVAAARAQARREAELERELEERQVERRRARVLEEVQKRREAELKAKAEAEEKQLTPYSGEQALPFQSLGNVYRTGKLIWSSSSLPMSFSDARFYCSSLGSGSRLPTTQEYEKLAIALGKGSPRGYQPWMLPDLDTRIFWSSTPSKSGTQSTAAVFDGSTGVSGNWTPGPGLLGNLNWVRCVREMGPLPPSPFYTGVFGSFKPEEM